MAAPMVRRRDAAQATLDKFKDKPFKWGVRDCSRMVAFHLRQLGYKVKLPPSGSYGTLLGAKRALKAAGFATVPEAIDAIGLERIAPAFATTGDLMEWPSENELAALGVVLGNGRMVAYHPNAAGAVVLQPIECIGAWRAVPL
jgi:hypothetical protein